MQKKILEVIKKKIGVILWLRETREDEFSDPNKKEGER